MTAHIVCDLPIEQCPQWEPHPSHDHSPVASKHCAGVEPMSLLPRIVVGFIDRPDEWVELSPGRNVYGGVLVIPPGMELAAPRPDWLPRDPDEVAPTADGRRVWIPNTESAETSLDGMVPRRSPVSDVPKTAPIKVTWTGEIDDQCDFPRCHNWSTHDVEKRAAVHRSCDTHLSQMIDG